MGLNRVLPLLILVVSARLEGQLVNASLAGSRESMVRQNQMASEEDLRRLRSKAAIKRSLSEGDLLSLRVHGNFIVDRKIPVGLQYAVPWTIAFLNEMNDSLRITFKKPVIVTSCVRDAITQMRLKKRLGRGAASAYGELPSTHLTGATCDISRRNLGSQERNYVRNFLKKYEKKCLVEATEHGKGKGKHFHVFVSRRYETRDECVPIPNFKMPKFAIKIKDPQIIKLNALVN